VHVTSLSRFTAIASSGVLRPRFCPVMREELLYCSYGEIVTRPSVEQKIWLQDPPVVIVLSPTVLARSYKFAPLDTGAIAAGRVPWFPRSLRNNLRSGFAIRDRGAFHLSRLISTLFGSHEGYLCRRGAVTGNSRVSEKWAAVLALSDAVHNEIGIVQARQDMRVISQIECHFTTDIELDRFASTVILPREAFRTSIPFSSRMLNITEIYDDQPDGENIPKALAQLTRNIFATPTNRNSHGIPAW
jgi:hypothetical protein